MARLAAERRPRQDLVLQRAPDGTNLVPWQQQRRGSPRNSHVSDTARALPHGRGAGVEYSTVEGAPFYAKTDAVLRTCVLRWWRAHKGGEDLTRDGTAIRPAGYLGETSVFHFTMPAHNNYLHVPGRTGGRAVYYGAASILRPLSPGTHTLVWAESYTHPDSLLKVTYDLTVG